MNKETRHNIQLYSVLFMLCVGAGLLIAGFIVIPTGVIHQSVLIGFGEILTFVGSIFGIDYHYKIISNKNNTND